MYLLQIFLAIGIKARLICLMNSFVICRYTVSEFSVKHMIPITISIVCDPRKTNHIYFRESPRLPTSIVMVEHPMRKTFNFLYIFLGISTVK